MTDITPLNAAEILTVITACHHRTAPRMDDPEVAQATATVWAELLNGYDFTVPELIAAVKSRAKTIPDAPEPADLIRVARAARNDELDRTIGSDISQDNDGWPPDVDPGETKAAPDPAAYPPHWTPEQRTRAYWESVRVRHAPTTTAGWEAMLRQSGGDDEAEIIGEISTDRLEAAKAALQTCQGRRESQAAIGEYMAARKAAGKPVMWVPSSRVEQAENHV